MQPMPASYSVLMSLISMMNQYTISWCRNRSQRYRSSKSCSNFATCLHGNSAVM